MTIIPTPLRSTNQGQYPKEALPPTQEELAVTASSHSAAMTAVGNDRNCGSTAARPKASQATSVVTGTIQPSTGAESSSRFLQRPRL